MGWRKVKGTTPLTFSVKHPLTEHQSKEEKQRVKFAHVSQHMLLPTIAVSFFWPEFCIFQLFSTLSSSNFSKVQLRTFSLLLRWNSLLCCLVAVPWTTWKHVLPLVSNLYIPSYWKSCWDTWKVSGGRQQKRTKRIWADAAETEEWDTHLAYRRENWDSK